MQDEEELVLLDRVIEALLHRGPFPRARISTEMLELALIAAALSSWFGAAPAFDATRLWMRLQTAIAALHRTAKGPRSSTTDEVVTTFDFVQHWQECFVWTRTGNGPGI